MPSVAQAPGVRRGLRHVAATDALNGSSGRGGEPVEKRGRTEVAAEVIGATGAILVVGLGLVFVFVISVVSLATVPASQKAAVVTAAFTVLGTIVGAYFGVKVGSANKDQAEAARDVETIKVQELAARVDPHVAKAALDSAQKRMEVKATARRH